MNNIVNQIAAACALLSLCDTRGYMLGPHRRMYPDFLSRCPESFRAMSYDDLDRSTVEELRALKASFEAPKDLGELPCGGVPVDENNVRCATPGDSVPIGWRVEAACASKCKVTMMCPGKQVSKEIWTGECGAAPGDVEIHVKIPAETLSCKSGECFLQWKMENDKQKTYFGCVDLKIDLKQPGESHQRLNYDDGSSTGDYGQGKDSNVSKEPSSQNYGTGNVSKPEKDSKAETSKCTNAEQDCGSSYGKTSTCSDPVNALNTPAYEAKDQIPCEATTASPEDNFPQDEGEGELDVGGEAMQE